MKKILIAEDEMPLRKVLADKFEREGYQAIEAVDGEEALSLALSEQPDMILLDIRMPKKDGIEVLREIRHNDWGKTVPVIFLTNLSGNEESQLEAVNETSPAFFLVKADVDIAEVFEKVESILAK